MSARLLLERLAQRGSEPLGVIDVRQPQQHYTRAAGWLGQRLPLLNQLLARYHDGGEHGTGAGGFVYRATHSFPPEKPTAFALENRFSPAAGVTRSIPIPPATAAGNDRPSPADTVLSAAAVSGSSAAPSELAPSTVARSADLTPSSGSHLGRVGIAHLAPAAVTRTATAVSARLLPERLAQRGNEPLGVIDAHQPQQHYSRVTGWLGQRSPGPHLGRVGIAHPISAVIATAAGTESPGAATATVARSADLMPSAAERGESSATPAVTLRVRRQAPPLADAVSALPSKPLTETTAAEHASPTAGLLNQPAAPSSLPSSEAMENRLAPPGDRPIAEAGRLSELQPTAVGPALAIARKAIGAVSSTSGARVDATPTAGALDPTRAGLPDSMPLARLTSALQLSESITGTADKPVLPVIPEKQMFSVANPVPSLIWRKSIATAITPGAGHPAMFAARTAAGGATHHAAGGGFTGTVQLMPAGGSAASSSRAAEEQPPAALPSTGFPKSELDWEQLITQVSRRILRQLTIERERRGGTKWR